MGPEELLQGGWEAETALFILPGGADLPYAQLLNGLGNNKIRSYVEEGGSFLGICAGSYFAGSALSFALGTPNQVTGTRELSFFPGVVVGPTLAPYDYFSHSGARAASIRWKGDGELCPREPYLVYYNGGGHFPGAEMYPGVKVLATYEGSDRLPAIIECQVKKGIALLSGVHFEYEATSDLPKAIFTSLKEAESRGRELSAHLLNRLLPDHMRSSPKKG